MLIPEILNSIWIKIDWKFLQINSNYTIENASISIIDIFKQEHFHATNQTINGNLEIPSHYQMVLTWW
jgi:hypothetical protein